MVELASNEFFYLGLILLFPLLGAMINGLLGRRLPKQAIWIIACGSIGLAFVFSLLSVAAMFQHSALQPDPNVAHMAAAQASQANAEANAELYQNPNAQKPLRREEDNKTFSPDLSDAPRAIMAPRLQYDVFTWIVSGDWADDTSGWQPSAMFEDPNPSSPKSMRASSSPMDATGPPDGHGIRERQPQKGIGGVLAKIDGSGHLFSSLTVRFGLTLDQLSAVMILIITGVGFLIHIYSIGYMRNDPTKHRYFAYLNLFCFSMLLLVLGSNLVVLFVGWEGVGLCSYLLIGYYYEDHANADAGKKAFIVNRVGDFAFVLGMFTIFLLFGTFDFVELQSAVAQGTTPYVEYGLITLACVLLFIGCTGKSAQIPLFVWLPDAMAGPTPVSALIHAATMVTAGIYLIARLNFLFALAPVAMAIIATIGALTAFFAATIALVQNDIKKVLAYSTISQLGYMFLGIGVGAWWAAVFHLMTHAFFKALLFLGAGSVIDAMHHEQNIKKMGGLRKYMPVTAWTFLVGCAAIAGVPLLSGFFSKDGILWYAWFNQNSALGTFAPYFSTLIWGLGVATAGLTAFYMFRLYFRTFEGKCMAPEETRAQLSESPTTMTIPLVALAGLSIVGGYVGLPHVLNMFHLDAFEALPLWLQSTLYASVPVRAMSHNAEMIAEWALMLISIGAAFAGILTAYRFYSPSAQHVVDADEADKGGVRYATPHALKARFPRVHQTLKRKYYVDEVYHLVFVRGALLIGRGAYAIIDRFLIDVLVVRMGAWTYQGVGYAFKMSQNGDMQRYAAFVVLGLLAVVYLVLF